MTTRRRKRSDVARIRVALQRFEAGESKPSEFKSMTFIEKNFDEVTDIISDTLERAGMIETGYKKKANVPVKVLVKKKVPVKKKIKKKKVPAKKKRAGWLANRGWFTDKKK